MQKFLIFILINIISCLAIADTQISRDIEALINKTDPNLNIGIKITNLDQNKVVFAKNTDRYFIPASTLKFVTITSFLEHFGYDYKFTNRVLKKDGNYYLDINDPEFDISSLDDMLSKITSDSSKIIEGDIYISNSSFTVPPLMHNKTYSDTIYCYGAPVTKVHINKNCSKLNVDVAQIGQKIQVIKPKYFPYNIENKAVTIPKKILDRLYVSIKDGKYIIDGTLSIKAGKVPIGAVANDNFAHIKAYLKERLVKHNIKLKGNILYGKANKSGKEVASFSKNIIDIAAGAMKRSDNFVTDYLLAEFATKNKQIDWRHAVQSMKSMIFEKFNVDFSKAELHDGSGISRMNLVTINQYDAFLKSVSRKSNFKKIKEIMARPGQDGTLQDRFKDMPNLYAKTGTMSNLSALIGYVYDKNNELHSFVIISNNFYGSRTPYRTLEEDILRTVQLFQ